MSSSDKTKIQMKMSKSQICLKHFQKIWKWLLMLGSWPLKDQKHCDRQTVPALNQDVGKSSRWMKSPRCKVKIPRRRKRSNALQESSGLTFSKLDVHSTNWRCPEPMRNPFCPLISSLLCTQGWSRLGRQQAWGEVGAGGLSAEFAELHFSVSHRNSGGGGRCVRHWAGSCCPQAACRALRAALVLLESRPAADVEAGLLRCNIFPSANVFASNQSDKWSGKKVFYHACEKDHRLNFEKRVEKIARFAKAVLSQSNIRLNVTINRTFLPFLDALASLDSKL